MGAGGSLIEQARKIGNDAFKNKDYPRAVEAYSRALDEESDAKLLCNRAVAYLHLNRPALALLDALEAAGLDPSWHKPYFRVAAALFDLSTTKAPSGGTAVCDKEGVVKNVPSVCDTAEIYASICSSILPNDDLVKQKLTECKGGCRDSRGLRSFVFSWGHGSSRCLGHGAKTGFTPSPKAVEGVNRVLGRVVDADCGMAHSALITSRGFLYVWGLNSNGQCGVPTNQFPEVDAPRLVTSLLKHKIVTVSCGAAHVVCLSDQGVALGFGSSNNGQLGTVPIGDVIDPKVLDPPNIDDKHTSDNNSRSEGRGQEFCWAGVSCGFAHTTLVEQRSRKLYACGWNRFGAVGVDSKHNVNSPAGVIVPKLTLVNVGSVRMVACGGSHTSVVTDEGDLFMMGANSCGQLGIGNTIDSPLPLNVGVGGPVAACSCGEEFSFVIREDRRLFAMGLNNRGQLGFRNEISGEAEDRQVDENGYSVQDICSKPHEVTCVQNVEWLVCAQGVVYVVDQDGVVWTFGANIVDPMGLPDVSKPNPTKVSRFLNYQVDSLACGRRHFLAVLKCPDAADAELLPPRKTPRLGQKVKLAINIKNDNNEKWEIDGLNMSTFVVDNETSHSIPHDFDTFQGDYELSFKPPDSGSFTVHCYLNGEHVQGSPKLIEVEAGPLSFDVSECTLRTYRRVGCGETLKFFVVAKDSTGIILHGGRQRVTVSCNDGNIAVDDTNHGSSEVVCTWTNMGRRELTVELGDDEVESRILRQCTVDVLPGYAHPPSCIFTAITTEENVAEDVQGYSTQVGVPYRFNLALKDQYGNDTNLAPPDFNIQLLPITTPNSNSKSNGTAKPKRGDVKFVLPPPPPIDEWELIPWNNPLPRECLLEGHCISESSGRYELRWTATKTSKRKNSKTNMQKIIEVGSIQIDIVGEDINTNSIREEQVIRPVTPLPESQEKNEELEKRNKMYERLRKIEATRRRAEEALRKKQEELREKKERERKKHKRVGGGFIVPFDPPLRRRLSTSKPKEGE